MSAFCYYLKQAVHEHIPNLITALGSSDSELLRIISDPPQGSEHLLALVCPVFLKTAFGE